MSKENPPRRPESSDLSSISPERLEKLADLAAGLSALDKLARTKPKGNA